MLILPNLIIIGAMKGGTTSLHHYLDAHPQIAMSKEKELKFFVANGDRNRWVRGLDWYGRQFAAHAPVRGESTPGYTKSPHFPGVPERMHGIIPHAQLIYVLRDPVERAISHYRHLYSSFAFDESLDALLASNRADRIVATSSYALQLEQYLPYYDLGQIAFVESEQLRAEPAGVLERICGWLGVDGAIPEEAYALQFHKTATKLRPNTWGRALHKRIGRHRIKALQAVPGARTLLFEPSQPPPISDDARALLAERLAPDVERMRQLTGLALDRWSI